MKRILCRLAIVAAFFAPAAFAQPAHSGPAPCSGVTVNVRVSEITPTGSVEKFMAAVTAHQAWYKSHGYKTNQIVVGKIQEQDPATKAWAYSDKKFLTYHINPPDPSTTKHDAGWDAYVKLYSETSKIVESYLTCMPETVVSTDPVPWMKM